MNFSQEIDDDHNEFADLPMPDIRKDWLKVAEKSELKGCGLHKNFSFDEFYDLEESLRERRILADVPTADVLEYYKAKKQKSELKKEYQLRRPKVEETTAADREAIKKDITAELKREIMQELLAELKGGPECHEDGL